jgi:drug/metabolite transporter (DMT)-like permease
MLRGQMPGASTLLGVALLVAGVIWALRVKPSRHNAADPVPH